jgi:hypothetical protein
MTPSSLATYTLAALDARDRFVSFERLLCEADNEVLVGVEHRPLLRFRRTFNL